MNKTAIEWTDATWNPIRGCSRVSEGCRHCYAERMAARFSGPGKPYEGVVEMRDGQPRWTGRVELLQHLLWRPTHWRKHRRVFVNSMSDLFHPSVTEDMLDCVFGTMSWASQHTYQILTKRPERMLQYMSVRQPLPNVWLGVSVEDQATADERIPHLLETPAAVRFVSCEPLLRPINVTNFLDAPDWVIVGGESGPGARPMHPDWVRSIRDQCVGARVPFFFKQWGEWVPTENRADNKIKYWSFSDGVGHPFLRGGKKKAGRLLDGREWNEFPEVVK